MLVIFSVCFWLIRVFLYKVILVFFFFLFRFLIIIVFFFVVPIILCLVILFLILPVPPIRLFFFFLWLQDCDHLIEISVRQDVVDEKGLEPDKVHTGFCTVQTVLFDFEVPSVKSDEVIHSIEVHEYQLHPSKKRIWHALQYAPLVIMPLARFKDDRCQCNWLEILVGTDNFDDHGVSVQCSFVWIMEVKGLDDQLVVTRLQVIRRSDDESTPIDCSDPGEPLASICRLSDSVPELAVPLLVLAALRQVCLGNIIFRRVQIEHIPLSHTYLYAIEVFFLVLPFEAQRCAVTGGQHSESANIEGRHTRIS